MQHLNSTNNNPRKMVIRLSLAALLALGAPLGLASDSTSDNAAVADPQPLIEAVQDQPSDDRIAARISNIYKQIEPLAKVEVLVKEGVVLLSGAVSNEGQAQRALNLATRLEGVVTVDDGIERTLDIQGNVAPFIDQLRDDLQRFGRALPLVLIALGIFLIILYAGHRVSNWSSLWQRIAPNPFLAQILSQAFRIAAAIFGLVIALNLIGANALLGTILGGAGVLGLAIGFAVRDTMENYISSIMLSLRQPFRANDHVVIGDQEGKVVRLTSRATILMTLDGNHLRIPNATVFKSIILNYTTNPDRRFKFQLGVDANDDPIAAMKIALDAIADLGFILKEPSPNAVIDTVGDSNIILTFSGWVNQTLSNYGKSRSLAIRAAKDVLEQSGFTLPEPQYRVRLADSSPAATEAQPGAAATKATPSTGVVDLDVQPDTDLETKVNQERASEPQGDLLDSNSPVE